MSSKLENSNSREGSIHGAKNSTSLKNKRANTINNSANNCHTSNNSTSDSATSDCKTSDCKTSNSATSDCNTSNYVSGDSSSSSSHRFSKDDSKAGL